MSNLNPNSINGLNLYAYAISNPVCIAYSSVFVGSIVTAVVVGTIVAVGISVAGAFVINYLGGMLDDEWKKFKEQIFE